MRSKSNWSQYAIYDEDGIVSGIREDAPPTAKREYIERIENIDPIELLL